MSYAELFPMNDEILHNCISALSDIRSHRITQKYTDPYRHVPIRSRTCVRMLEGISTLMIYSAKNEVCAVSLVEDNLKTKGEVKIYWAKNDAAKPSASEQRYINSLLRMFTAQEKHVDILRLVVEQCVEKILSRCRSARSQFEYSPSSNTADGKCTQSEVLEDRLKLAKTREETMMQEGRLKSAGLIKPTATLADCINQFLWSIRNLEKKDGTDSICWVIIFANFFTDYLSEDNPGTIFNRLQVRAMKKLGCYFSTILVVLKACKDGKITTLREEQVGFI